MLNVHRSTLYQLRSEIVVVRRAMAPARRRELLVAAALIAYGAFLMLHSAWASTSDRKAAVLFRASSGCELRTQDSLSLVPAPCRIESAVVLERRWYTTKGDGTAYDLVIRSARGTRDEMQMYEKATVLFWRRAAPGEVITVQRFVAPGYRLTGSITALGDKRGWIMMPTHPDRPRQNEGVFILLGGFLLTCGTLLSASWIRRSRAIRSENSRSED